MNTNSENRDSGAEFKSGGDPFGSASGPEIPQSQPAAITNVPWPKLWIGYLLALVTLIGEIVAVARHPEILNTKEIKLVVPPLEMFLPAFVAYVFWLVCVYRYHKILAAIPRYTHPISPAKAVAFHFIPLYYLIWFFIWPNEIAKFVNARFKLPLMRGWVFGVGAIGAIVCSIFVNPGIGIALLFLSTNYVGGFLKRALSVPEQASPI